MLVLRPEEKVSPPKISLCSPSGFRWTLRHENTSSLADLTRLPNIAARTTAEFNSNLKAGPVKTVPNAKITPAFFDKGLINIQGRRCEKSACEWRGYSGLASLYL